MHEQLIFKFFTIFFTESTSEIIAYSAFFPYLNMSLYAQSLFASNCRDKSTPDNTVDAYVPITQKQYNLIFYYIYLSFYIIKEIKHYY